MIKKLLSTLIFLSVICGAPDALADSAFVSGQLVKTIKPGINLKDQAYILTGTEDPTLSAKDGPIGSIYLRVDTSGGTAYIKQDAGLSTNWSALGSSSSPLTTKGDIYVFSGADDRLPVGVDGEVLSADSSSLTGLKWIPVGGTGTVTSVDLTMPAEFSVSGNPVTTSGTLAVAKANQNANLVYAGPAAGVPAAPSFRSLVSLDIPDLSAIYLLLSGGTMSGTLVLNADPVNPLEASTKQYVDSTAANGVAKGACVYATTAPLPANLYANGASGVGATLTGISVGALSLDGNAVSVGQRVLIKNEVAAENNGIYTVTAAGSGIAVYVLTRATDFNSTADIVDGATTFITSGATLGFTTWQLDAVGAVTVGTTDLDFNQIAGPGTIVAGAALSYTGSTLNVLFDNAGIGLNGSNQLIVKANGVANSNLAQMPANTIKGNNTGGAADPIDLTVTQTTAMLNPFVGDSGAGGLKGLVPAPAAGDAAANKFLKSDGTWSAVPGSSGSVSGGTFLNISSIYTDHTTTTADDILIAVTTGGSFIITLQPSSQASNGSTTKPLRVKVVGSRELYIQAANGDFIDGETMQVLQPNHAAVELIPDGGTNYYVF